jgi:hypothetical protein
MLKASSSSAKYLGVHGKDRETTNAYATRFVQDGQKLRPPFERISDRQIPLTRLKNNGVAVDFRSPEPNHIRVFSRGFAANFSDQRSSAEIGGKEL